MDRDPMQLAKVVVENVISFIGGLPTVETISPSGE
jgi:hypothetical protein